MKTEVNLFLFNPTQKTNPEKLEEQEYIACRENQSFKKSGLKLVIIVENVMLDTKKV